MMMVSGSESKKELLLLTAAAKDFEFLFVEDKRKIYRCNLPPHLAERKILQATCHMA